MVNHPNRSKRHTPGPWSIGPSGTMVISGPRRDFVHGQVIASISAGPGKNTVANGRLIAAAPDLLAALSDLAEVVEVAIDAGLFLSVDGKRPDVQALRIAREALAKVGE